MHATARRNPAHALRRRPGLAGVTWIKSHHSNPERHCPLAAPADGALITLVNSRDLAGPALIITRPSSATSSPPPAPVTSTT